MFNRKTIVRENNGECAEEKNFIEQSKEFVLFMAKTNGAVRFYNKSTAQPVFSTKKTLSRKYNDTLMRAFDRETRVKVYFKVSQNGNEIDVVEIQMETIELEA